MYDLTTESRAELEPMVRRAFVGPAVAEWAKRLGKTLVVSTSEDDDTASANCAVEVVLSLEGPVRGTVTYTLAPQTALTLAGSTSDSEESSDPIPAIRTFFGPLALKSRELLRSSGAECKVVLASVKDVRGRSYGIPANNFPAVHMVSQPTDYDEELPETVSLWFDLESDRPASVPETGGDPRASEPHREPPRKEDASAASRTQPAAATNGTTPVLRTSRLEIVDQSGVARAVVSTLADGSPHIIFADKDGRIRAAISLAKDGQPRLLFLDEMGRRILDLPQALHTPQASHAAQAAQQPAAPPARPTQPPQVARRPGTPPAPPQAGGPRPPARAGAPQPPPARPQPRRPGPPEPPRRP